MGKCIVSTRSAGGEIVIFTHNEGVLDYLQRYTLLAITKSPGTQGARAGSGFRPVGEGLLSGRPLALGQHGAGLLTGDGVHQVVAEEDLRRSGTGRTVLSDIVGTDVDGGGGRRGDHLDGHSLAVGTGHTVGLTLGGFDDELQVGHVCRDTGQREGEGLTLAGNGCCTGILDTDECRRILNGSSAAGNDPVVQTGEQVGAGNLGLGAKHRTSLLREGQLVPGEDLGTRQALPLGGELLEDALDLGLVSSTDRAAVTPVTDVLAALHLSGRNALGAAAHLLEGDGRNVLHKRLSFRRLSKK